ncbi:MMPL family transporter [Agromyces tropicus]|uniref:MMPL family transporter n=2 Tax=Agromyces tropicus TaxID=555371 RepID=A0ABN2TZ81_9MICO
MERLATFALRRSWVAITCWIALLVAVTALGGLVGSAFDDDYALPGTQSQQVSERLEARSPSTAGDRVTVVLHDERGWDADTIVPDLVADLATIDHVAAVVPPDAGRGTVSEDGSVGLLDVALDGPRSDMDPDTYRRIVDVADAHRTDGLDVELSGRGIRQATRGGGSTAEFAGLLAALVILVLMFGSFLAASLPLITAVLAVGSTVGLASLLSHVLTVPGQTTAMLVLVGLGVGIDYALLILTRYRAELRSGADRSAATRTALDTAGRSVLFAGTSVIIALSGLFTLGVAAYEGTVTAVALTVLITMLASLTLLPSLLTVFGRRIERRARARDARGAGRADAWWRRWSDLVQRRPVVSLVAAVVVLGSLAAPALGMRLGFGDAGNDDPATTTRAAYDLISEKFGPGANGPLVVLTQGTEADALAARAVLADAPGVAAERLGPPVRIDADLYLTRVEPTTGPQDAATADLVRALRTDLGDPHLVGGATAANVDFADAMAARFPVFLLVVVGLSGLLLLTVFRSVAIAVKAAVFNLLSIGAALGATTLVFQDGLTWAEPGPIEAFGPVFIFAIVFGLSMDYEVFLLSRMREEWVRTRDPRAAVREGLARTGGVITAAAAIMVVVFGSFVLAPDRMLQQLGFAMAMAVLLDALVVRCLAVPAAMALLGARAWWLPRALQRALPDVHVEGRARMARSAPGSAVVPSSEPVADSAREPRR